MSFSLATHYSNRVEQLYEYFKKTLFSSKTKPFTRRLVAVSSPALKSWLLFQLAKDSEIGIAAGLEIGLLDELIQKLRGLTSLPKAVNKKIPTLTELGLALEIELRQICDTFVSKSEEDKEIYFPLIRYLHIDPHHPITRKSEKRLLSLAFQLAELFIHYGKYGYKMVNSWDSSAAQHWQQSLWNRLFNPHSPWMYLSKDLNAHFSTSLSEIDLQVNLFSMGYLPPLYHHYLERISALIPVNYFLLSPCQFFWSDIHSDKEANRLIKTLTQQGLSEKQTVELEDLLRDRNPLLANFGRLGREMAQLIENSSSSTIEHYFLPKTAELYYRDRHIPYHTELVENSEPFTLLQALQTDMLLLRNPALEPKISFENWDESVQVHSSSSKYREIQALYNLLIGLMRKHAHESHSISLSDIIVMAPNINEYEPFIRLVFEAKESCMDVEIMDLQMPGQNQSLQAFLHLLLLSTTRWDAASLLTLLDFPEFKRKHRLSNEELYEVREWIQKAEIRWGNDSGHREELLSKDHGSHSPLKQGSVGTWEFGIQRLLTSLVFSENEKADCLLSPLPIESSKTEFLGQFIKLLNSLREDLKPLSEGKELSLQDWVSYLRCLHETYFIFDDDENQQTIEEVFNSLKGASKYFVHKKFSFQSLKKHIEVLLNTKKTTYRETRLHAIHFCSLLPMRTIPSKIVVLLGMQEGAFPRSEINTSLNLLTTQSDADYRPTQTDFDRYLFLEAVLSSRKYFIMSYLSLTEEDFKEQSPSLLVTELLNYLDKAYEIRNELPSKICQFKHPFYSFDKTYFSEKSILKSYIQHDFKLACAHYHFPKRAPYSFIPSFSFPDSLSNISLKKENRPFPTFVAISLNELESFARNPLKTYFNVKLNMYLQNEKDSLEVEESLLLSNLKIDYLKKASLKKSFEEILSHAQSKGYFAPGIYKELSVKTLKDKIQEIHENLHEANIKSEELFEIEFNNGYLFPNKSQNGNWLLPPLNFKGNNGIVYKITGKIQNVSPWGLLEHYKKQELGKIWPKFLIFHSLIKAYELPIAPQIIFGKTGEVKKSFFESASPLLNLYLDYYFASLVVPSPLLPEWIPLFINEEKQTLLDKLKDSLYNSDNFYNDYALWIFKHSNLPENITEWKITAQQLYGEAFDNWF